MEGPLRPDLARILPAPWTTRVGADSGPLAQALRLPDGAGGEDYRVEVQRHDARRADDPGFDLTQAMRVAARLRDLLLARPDTPSLHRADAGRAGAWLAADGMQAALAPPASRRQS